MSGANVVPFGKYKGHPVENMLADHEYMTWVEAQPWFRDRYLHLLSRRDAEAASRTPVHNKLQTLFLNEDYQRAFLTVTCSKFGAAIKRMGSINEIAREAAKKVEVVTQERINSRLKEIAELKRTDGWQSTNLKDELEAAKKALAAQIALLDQFAASQHAAILSVRAKFEVAGVDVVLLWKATYPNFEPLQYLGYTHYTHARIGQAVDERRLPVEIKPSVADEYPAILRQMLRNESEYLFVGSYAAEGATEQQFVSMFAASGRTVVFKREVDRAVAEAMLQLLDEAGVQLSIQPSGKVTIMPGTAAPEVLVRARSHRDAITALLIERSTAPKPPAAVVEEDTL